MARHNRTGSTALFDRYGCYERAGRDEVPDTAIDALCLLTASPLCLPGAVGSPVTRVVTL